MSMEEIKMLLQVKDLTINFEVDGVDINVVDGVNFSLEPGKSLGIVGESGSGKSVTAFGIQRLLPRPSGKIVKGEVIYKNKDLLKFSLDDMRSIRGKEIGMIFQEPMNALNPVKTIFSQIAEIFDIHSPMMSFADKKVQAIKLLTEVGIPSPETRMHEYPHQLSGGMRQRVMIAMALGLSPGLLIADEPTTALDVTIQAQILKLIKKLQVERNMGLILITHDLAVVSEVCDHVLVMYAGRVCEYGPVNEVMLKPAHPYTKLLLDSLPSRATKPKTKLATIEGRVPDVFNFPKGCRFHPRCPYASEECKNQIPPLNQFASDRMAYCLHTDKVLL
jgi:peptide/nickel transport system ATP-binding protein